MVISVISILIDIILSQFLFGISRGLQSVSSGRADLQHDLFGWRYFSIGFGMKSSILPHLAQIDTKTVY